MPVIHIAPSCRLADSPGAPRSIFLACFAGPLSPCSHP
jgi:hypothetical protein